MHVLDACESLINGLSFLAVSVLRHTSRYHKLFRRRLLQLFLLTFVLWSSADIFLVHRHFHEEQIHLDYKPPERQRIFIASALWDKERTIPSQWNDAFIELTNVFGADNIFVSIYESGNSDGTRDALRKLDKALEGVGVQRKIIFAVSSSDNEALKNPPADRRHIATRARLRNLSLRPLYDLRDAGTFFDRILFLNDVVFTVGIASPYIPPLADVIGNQKEDVLSLLNTNYGTYTAACSFDILNSPSGPDALALRDADGHENVMQKWPFFRSARSREAMKFMLPVPVRSCWGDMVFMGTEEIYSTRPYQFRGVPDGLADKHVVASESCLIHADNYISKRRGVYLNPFVRVGYNTPAYAATRPENHWLSTWEIFESIWENRLRRWFSSPFLKEWSLRSRIAKWKAEDENNKERGEFCLTNEVQATET
ncbi:cryptococcal mannosyltransferase 1-domain-containing protein [Aspergillus recurvatus]